MVGVSPWPRGEVGDERKRKTSSSGVNVIWGSQRREQGRRAELSGPLSLPGLTCSPGWPALWPTFRPPAVSEPHPPPRCHLLLQRPERAALGAEEPRVDRLQAQLKSSSSPPGPTATLSDSVVAAIQEYQRYWADGGPGPPTLKGLCPSGASYSRLCPLAADN